MLFGVPEALLYPAVSSHETRLRVVAAAPCEYWDVQRAVRGGVCVWRV
jgi:hypothetical protein